MSNTDKINDNELNAIFKEVLGSSYDSDPLIYKNIELFEWLFAEVYAGLYDIYCKYYDINIDWNKVSHANFLEKIDIINDFYKSLNIDFDANVVVDDGTFDMNSYSVQEAMRRTNLFFDGHCGIHSALDGGKYIEVGNTDLITDSIVWVHELSHYRNIMEFPETDARSYLTESLAFTYQFMFSDYLMDNGYREEGLKFKISELLSLYWATYNALKMMKLLLVYDKFGMINKENYLRIFKSDYYDEDITAPFFIKKRTSFRTCFNYGVAGAFGLYMYSEFCKDNSYLPKIEELNEKIKTHSFWECVNYLGFHDYGDDGIEPNKNKIRGALEHVYSLINKEYDELNKDIEKSKFRV